MRKFVIYCLERPTAVCRICAMIDKAARKCGGGGWWYDV